MNKKRIAITIAVIVALAWAVAFACSGKKPAPVAPKAPVVVEQPVARAHEPVKHEPVVAPAPAPAPQCKADPKLLPKKVQPKAKLIAPAPQPIVKARPSARYHGDRAPVLLPNQ